MYIRAFKVYIHVQQGRIKNTFRQNAAKNETTNDKGATYCLKSTCSWPWRPIALKILFKLRKIPRILIYFWAKILSEFADRKDAMI